MIKVREINEKRLQMTSYNASVITDYKTTITYRNFSERKINSLIEYVEKNISFRVIFFYRKSSWKAKMGKLEYVYSKKKGLVRV